MTPFIGYHAGDYMQHWFDMGEKLGDKAPRCFYVNWFRKTDDGKWLWPGFGENSPRPEMDVRPRRRQG